MGRPMTIIIKNDEDKSKKKNKKDRSKEYKNRLHIVNAKLYETWRLFIDECLSFLKSFTNSFVSSLKIILYLLFLIGNCLNWLSLQLNLFKTKSDKNKKFKW